MPEIFDASEHTARHTKNVDEYSRVMAQEPVSTNPLDSFAAKPLNIFFDSQHSDENVILLLRKHPVTQIGWILIVIGMILLPILFSAVSLLDFLPPRYGTAALVGWYALIFSYIVESFLMWFFNVYIITDERVIDVDFLSLLYKNVTSAKIDNIEDVTAETGGILRSFFDYGTVKIQTAGTQNEIEFEDVPHPAKVTRLMNELIIQEQQEELEGRAI